MDNSEWKKAKSKAKKKRSKPEPERLLHPTQPRWVNCVEYRLVKEDDPEIQDVFEVHRRLHPLGYIPPDDW